MNTERPVIDMTIREVLERTGELWNEGVVLAGEIYERVVVEVLSRVENFLDRTIEEAIIGAIAVVLVAVLVI